MDYIQIIILLVVMILEYFGIKKLNDAYMTKKGENIATKEDIAEITRKTEEVKDIFQQQQYQYQQVYDIKVNAIQRSLDFLDTYLSWKDYSSGVTPARECITISDLTMRARECYNRLIITCEDENLLKDFNDILFINDNDFNYMLAYNNFRNLARKELGLNHELSLDSDKVFFSKIATKDLERIEMGI